jgi:hypothetical protein
MTTDMAGREPAVSGWAKGAVAWTYDLYDNELYLAAAGSRDEFKLMIRELHAQQCDEAPEPSGVESESDPIDEDGQVSERTVRQIGGPVGTSLRRAPAPAEKVSPLRQRILTAIHGAPDEPIEPGLEETAPLPGETEPQEPEAEQPQGEPTATAEATQHLEQAGALEVGSDAAGSNPEPAEEDTAPPPPSHGKPASRKKRVLKTEPEGPKAQEPGTIPVQQQTATTVGGAEKVVSLAIDQIDLKAGTESRPLHDKVVREYAQMWREGVKFLPIRVVRDGKNYLLTDGFHRVAAAKLAGLKVIEAIVIQGDRVKALEESLRSNHTHGQPRSNGDKRYAVDKALREFGDRSDRQLAELCGVSRMLVGERRKVQAGQKPTTVSSDSSTKGKPPKRVGKDGKARSLPRRKAKATQPQADEGRTADGSAKHTWQQALRELKEKGLALETSLGRFQQDHPNSRKQLSKFVKSHIVRLKAKLARSPLAGGRKGSTK